MRYKDIKTIDQRIAEHQAAIAQYLPDPHELDHIVLYLQCASCSDRFVKNLGWLRRGFDRSGILIQCHVCGKRHEPYRHSVELDLIQEYHDTGREPLVLVL